MLAKKSNTYDLIKKNITKLAVIQEGTEYSPRRLAYLFLLEQGVKDIDTDSAYKYFLKHLREYHRTNKNNASHQLMVNSFKNKFLGSESNLDPNYEQAVESFRESEKRFKSFVREAFKAVNPITADMTPADIARRNQKLGKISVDTWVADIINYVYFNDGAKPMIDNLTRKIILLDSFIRIFLFDKQLEIDIQKLSLNEKLNITLQKENGYTKPKAVKI